MKYLVSYDDGLFIHSCVVEVPKGTDEFTMFEIATEQYTLCWDFFGSYDDYLRWATEIDASGYSYTPEEIEDMWMDYEWSERLQRFLCV